MYPHCTLETTCKTWESVKICKTSFLHHQRIFDSVPSCLFKKNSNYALINIYFKNKNILEVHTFNKLFPKANFTLKRFSSNFKNIYKTSIVEIYFLFYLCILSAYFMFNHMKIMEKMCLWLGRVVPLIHSFSFWGLSYQGSKHGQKILN